MARRITPDKTPEIEFVLRGPNKPEIVTMLECKRCVNACNLKAPYCQLKHREGHGIYVCDSFQPLKPL